MNQLSTSSLLVAAVGIILRGKRLLVHETSQGDLELPGYIIAHGEKASNALQKFLREQDLLDLPQQSLYLTAVTVDRKTKRKAIGLVRIIHFSKKPNLKLPNHRFETFDQLLEDEYASPLTKAVARWFIKSD